MRGPSPYRVPVVVLAYPDRDTALPADKPVVLLRFAPREADDPIDITSFRATVDGVDRTGWFRVTSSEAWGTLGDTIAGSAAASSAAATAGPHTLATRVCTARGACGGLTVVVEVRPWDRALDPSQTSQRAPLMPNNTATALHLAAASGSSRSLRAGA